MGGSKDKNIPLLRVDVPQVKCALWQAKHALLAFFRLGLRGSFGSYFFLSPLAAIGSAILSSSPFASVSESSSFSDTGSETSAPLSSMSWGILPGLYTMTSPLLGAYTADQGTSRRRSCSVLLLLRIRAAMAGSVPRSLVWPNPSNFCADQPHQGTAFVARASKGRTVTRP